MESATKHFSKSSFKNSGINTKTRTASIVAFHSLVSIFSFPNTIYSGRATARGETLFSANMNRNNIDPLSHSINGLHQNNPYPAPLPPIITLAFLSDLTNQRVNSVTGTISGYLLYVNGRITNWPLLQWQSGCRGLRWGAWYQGPKAIQWFVVFFKKSFAYNAKK